jgi:murein DD-endopeptidase MepM/ murein hydrolase activator NlpD
MVIQLVICSCIYALFFVIKNKENSFSKQTVEKVSSVLNYDINLKQIYISCEEYFRNQKKFELNTENHSEEIVETNEMEETEQEQQEQENQVESEIEENAAEINNEVNLENQIQEEQPKEEQVPETNKSEMELDAEYIKQNYSLIIPVTGNITSGFGDREPTEIISAFHQGVDISAVQGTPICASMEGTVIAASYAGDYGNHIKIQNGEVITVYAHCSEINVNVGDYVAQNQVIGKVGATRKSNRCTFAL